MTRVPQEVTRVPQEVRVEKSERGLIPLYRLAISWGVIARNSLMQLHALAGGVIARHSLSS